MTVKQGVLPDEYTVYYDGLLTGADHVYLHYGIGHNDWTDIRTALMEKADGCWRKTVSVSGHWSLCFRDSASNWDNNNGRNWIGK